MMNLSRNSIVFVPGCLLCPSYQANVKKNNYIWSHEFLSFLCNNKFEIVQMPCPESAFIDRYCGLSRKPHGVKFYEALPGFNEHCQFLSSQVVKQICDFSEQGYHVIAVLGVEHSPTCSVSYMYTRFGTVHRSGIFIKYVMDALIEAKLEIPVIGINRRYPQKAIAKLSELQK